MEYITNATKNNQEMTLNICLNYGGQSEIVDAAKKMVMDIINNNEKIENIDVDNFSKYLYQNIPPIDLLIRTSGECRISNFMLWQMSYSEFYFTNTLFPDFDELELDKAIDAYNNRDRKFGGVKVEK